MSWRSEWTALSSRMEAFAETARSMVAILHAQNTDNLAVTRHYILPEARAILAELDVFFTRHRSAVPAEAAVVIQEFLAKKPAVGDGQHPLLDLQIAAPLAVIRARVEYLLRDRERSIRALTERAFEHLQRLIMVDGTTRERWGDALREGETKCEALGAVHLLSHGIWAFKVKGSGDAPGAAEATDLVYGDPIQGADQMERVSDGVVLTEWKAVRTPSEVEPQTRKAIAQAELYRAGVLGGLELTRTRYVVLVSENVLLRTDVRDVSGIEYRRIMIRVAPAPASKAARSA